MILRALSVIIILNFCMSCSSLRNQDLISKGEYVETREALQQPDVFKARLAYPKDKEKNGFVTTVEQGWLDFLANRPDPLPLRQISNDLESRKTERLSLDVKTFFYKASEDEYYPAEHEVIMLHLLTALAYAGDGARKESLIETRRAARYLQKEFGDRASFDDTSLRMLLAALWIYHGEWDSAKVDLRVAAKLSKDASIEELAKQKHPPKDFSVVFAGTGPDVEWAPEIAKNIVSGLGSVKFDFEDRRNPVEGNGKGLTVLSTDPWFARHQERDFALRDAVHGSRYAIDTVAHGTASGAILTVGVTAGVVIIVAGVAAGLAALVYIGPYAGDAAAYVATFVAGGGILAGTAVIQTTYGESKEVLHAATDRSRYYRFVRFLPSQIIFQWEGSPKDILKPNYSEHMNPITTLNSPDNETAIRFFYMR